LANFHNEEDELHRLGDDMDANIRDPVKVSENKFKNRLNELLSLFKK